MTTYKIKADSALDARGRAFGARVCGSEVLLPTKLAQALERFVVGDDAVTVASFLDSFPTAVATTLNVSPQAIKDAAEALIAMLAESGADVSRLRRPTPSRTRGARHPAQLVNG